MAPTNGKAASEKAPPESISQPERERLTQQVAIMQKAAQAQSAARNMREKAKKIADPNERGRMMKQAYEKEVEAHGQSKLAQRMQSGTWQGGAAGGGIGAGVGLGLGAVVGTLVGGLVSVPTTGLGTLIGAGVGAIHGPFIKIGGKDKKWEEAQPEEVVDALEQGRVEELPDAEPASEENSSTPPRRTPRKLQVRSNGGGGSAVGVSPREVDGPRTLDDVVPGTENGVAKGQHAATSQLESQAASTPPTGRPRKPRKIEVRSRADLERSSG